MPNNIELGYTIQGYCIHCQQEAAWSPSNCTNTGNVHPVACSFQHSPQHSAHRHSIALHLTPRTVRRIVHEDLKFHPFKIQVVQQLLPRDLKQWSQCCRRLLQMIERESHNSWIT
jgi:hypothetical protein